MSRDRLLQIRMGDDEAELLDKLAGDEDRSAFVRRLLLEEKIRRAVPSTRCTDPLHLTGAALVNALTDALGGAAGMFVEALMKSLREKK